MTTSSKFWKNRDLLAVEEMILRGVDLNDIAAHFGRSYMSIVKVRSRMELAPRTVLRHNGTWIPPSERMQGWGPNPNSGQMFAAHAARARKRALKRLQPKPSKQEVLCL